MTRTEERLQDALRASASRVHDERLCPLPDLAEGATRGRRAPSAPPWLIPAAAALAVLVAIGLGVTLAQQTHQKTGSQAGGTLAQPPGPPRYYAEVEGKMYRWHGTDSVEVVVRATASGAVVARVRNPVIAGQPEIMPFSVAAAPGNRTFYAIYRNYGGGSELWIYRFSILPSGHVSTLTRISGGPIAGQNYLGNVGGFTVSPDGTRLALAVASDHDPNSATSAVAGQIVVINLHTGGHVVWRGGLSRPGQVFGIQTLSWTGDGRFLAFQAQWCPPLDISYGPYGGFVCSTLASDPQDPQAEGVAEMREIHVTSQSDGTLSSGKVFMRASEHLQPGMPAIVDPGGRELITMVAADAVDTFEVVKKSIVTGATTSDLGQVPGGWQDEFHLAADRSGRHVLVWMSGNAVNPLHGWVDGGYHQLAPTFAVNYPGNWIQLTW
jgi:hypothetical protein